jgi:hypothetical protein
MKRRSALKSMMAAFTGASFFTGGSFTMVAKQPSRTALCSTTMIETRDGTRLHFRDWGGGRPIVFVAPWGLNSDWWDAPVLSLSQRGWRCVTFDRRGNARSDDPCRGYDFDTLADDIAAILDGLDLQNIVLVGHGLKKILREPIAARLRRWRNRVRQTAAAPPKLCLDEWRHSVVFWCSSGAY